MLLICNPPIHLLLHLLTLRRGNQCWLDPGFYKNRWVWDFFLNFNGRPLEFKFREYAWKLKLIGSRSVSKLLYCRFLDLTDFILVRPTGSGLSLGPVLNVFLRLSFLKEPLWLDDHKVYVFNMKRECKAVRSWILFYF